MDSRPRLHVGKKRGGLPSSSRRFFAGMTEGEAPIRDAPKEPGNGNVACYDVEILRLRFAPLGMTGGCRYGVGLEGDDSGGEGIMMDSRPRLHGGGGRFFAGMTEGAGAHERHPYG